MPELGEKQKGAGMRSGWEWRVIRLLYTGFTHTSSSSVKVPLLLELDLYSYLRPVPYRLRLHRTRVQLTGRPEHSCRSPHTYRVSFIRTANRTIGSRPGWPTNLSPQYIRSDPSPISGSALTSPPDDPDCSATAAPPPSHTPGTTAAPSPAPLPHTPSVPAHTTPHRPTAAPDAPPHPAQAETRMAPSDGGAPRSPCTPARTAVPSNRHAPEPCGLRVRVASPCPEGTAILERQPAIHDQTPSRPRYSARETPHDILGGFVL